MCLTEIYTLNNLKKHIGMTTVKTLQNLGLIMLGCLSSRHFATR